MTDLTKVVESIFEPAEKSMEKAKENLAACFEEVEKERDKKLEEAKEPRSWYKAWVRGEDAGGIKLTSEYDIKDHYDMVSIFVAILYDINADEESRKAWQEAVNIRAELLRQGFNGALVDQEEEA